MQSRVVEATYRLKSIIYEQISQQRRIHPLSCLSWSGGDSTTQSRKASNSLPQKTLSPPRKVIACTVGHLLQTQQLQYVIIYIFDSTPQTYLQNSLINTPGTV
jgi:hypothetical protein